MRTNETAAPLSERRPDNSLGPGQIKGDLSGCELHELVEEFTICSSSLALLALWAASNRFRLYSDPTLNLRSLY